MTDRLIRRLESLYRHLTEEGWHVHANTVAITLEYLPQWKPIETAPKDGSRILGLCDDTPHTLDYQKPYSHPPHIHHKEEWVQVSDSGRATAFEPTYWMPLPKPPRSSNNDA